MELESQTGAVGATHRQCAQCAHPLSATDHICPFCGVASPPDKADETNIWRHYISIVLIVTAIFIAVYRGVESMGLMQTYAAFLGIPLLIGVLTTYLSRPKTRVGMTLHITTIVMCLAAMMLGEGAICILMAAPIFYVIALIGCGIVTLVEDVFGKRGRGGPAVLVLLPFVAAKLTSTPQGIANPSTITVQNQVFIAVPPPKVWSTLLHGPLVSPQFPLFLKLGFPLPTKLERGARGVVRLTFDPGSEPWPGTNVIVSQEQRDAVHHRLTFKIVEDGTKLSRWLTFRRTSFVAEPVAGGCRLRQITTFQQRMQPGFYWNPVQSFAMTQMHAYALEHIKKLAENSSVPPL